MTSQAAIRYWLVVPAAGGGHRFGGEMPKQYASLAGRSLIEWALAPFLDDERCRGMVVALAPDDHWFESLPLASHPRLIKTTGGSQRADSVRLALDALSTNEKAEEKDWVLVHDAARPCVSAAEIDALLEISPEEIGAVLAVPVADTIKRGDGHEHVRHTEDRSALWRALTPQVFRMGLLRSALAAASQAGRVPTDESQAVEWLGHQPRLVRGSARNIKVTEPGDLALAEFMLTHGSPD
ncbi:MAG: 2-C-methyl-D-erythritol 4-phosphate cytidylyltransferase [Pseudomonadota bacterium]